MKVKEFIQLIGELDVANIVIILLTIVSTIYVLYVVSVLINEKLNR